MIDYRIELLKTFKDDAYWLVNKHLASHLGLVPTILLSELISKENYHYQKSELIEDKYFYHKSEVIEDNLFITSDKRRSCVEILKNSGTISVITKGMPAKHYYSVNHKRIIELMAMDTGSKENRESLKPTKIRSETPSQDIGNSSDKEIQSLDVPFSDLRGVEIQPKTSEKQSTCHAENGISIYNNKENIKDNIKCENNKSLQKERELLGNPEQFGKTEQPHTQKDPDLNDPKIRELAMAFGIDLDNPDTHTPEETQLTTTKQTEIEQHYSNEIAKVEQEYNLQRDISIPKLSIDSLLTASEDFLGRCGLGFDNNPRRILNLIYKQLPKDFVIKEDSKDVDILGDMIKKYTSSNRDERESIAKRIYQAVEAMLKIYVIKKYGEPYREVIFPDIAKANLALYLNCNPTFKYCLGGFSNDIDGVYTEICRLAEKDAKKKVSQIKIEHNGKIRSLETDRLLEMQSIFTEDQKIGFQERTNNILRRMDVKEDIEDQPLARPIQPNLTEEEKQELNRLFVKPDKNNEDVLQLSFLIKKSRKL